MRPTAVTSLLAPEVRTLELVNFRLADLLDATDQVPGGRHPKGNCVFSMVRVQLPMGVNALFPDGLQI
jgi:hypothetical protein